MGHMDGTRQYAEGRATGGGGFSTARGLTGLRRCLVLWGLSFREFWVSCWLGLALLLVGSGLGVMMVPRAMRSVRKLADKQRELALRWHDLEIPAAYGPQAPADTRARTKAQLLVKDSQAWRDYRWISLVPVVGGALSFGPIALIISALWGIAMVFSGTALAEQLDGLWYLFIPVNDQLTATLSGVLGIAQLPLALWAAPRAEARHARFNHKMLAPSESALMADRIEHLTATRTDAVDTQMAEIRRIERDLHDGAQARLVAMGMTLDAAEHLLESNPDAVRALLVEARQSSAKALEELRDLVRGIHPPVLADRGLGDAVRSLAMISPLKTEVKIDLPARPEPPVESAAYFAVSEILTNAAKHSGAERAWIDIRQEEGMLRIGITDDGRGGADMTRGTGLRGIERRLATFDGVLALNSPVNGPTMVTMELPCELSSRKTTSS